MPSNMSRSLKTFTLLVLATLLIISISSPHKVLAARDLLQSNPNLIPMSPQLGLSEAVAKPTLGKSTFPGFQRPMYPPNYFLPVMPYPTMPMPTIPAMPAGPALPSYPGTAPSLPADQAVPAPPGSSSKSENTSGGMFNNENNETSP